jgi:hypothetical protein
VLVQCPVGTQYNAKKELCESESECIEIVCPEPSETGNDVYYFSYDHDSQFFVSCGIYNFWNSIVYKCPYDLVFNEALAMCGMRTTNVDPTKTTTATIESTTVGFTTNTYVCPSVGLFPGLYKETSWIGIVN